jgi:hypothetical protein
MLGALLSLCFSVLSVLSFVLPFLSIVYLYIFCPHVTHSSTTHNTNTHAPGGIRILNTSKRSAADPRLRPLCRWDRQESNPGYPDCEAGTAATTPRLSVLSVPLRFYHSRMDTSSDSIIDLIKVPQHCIARGRISSVKLGCNAIW